MITHNGRKMHCLQNLCGCWQVAIFQFSVSLIYIYYVFLRAFFSQYLACHKIAISFTRESARDKEIPIEPKTDKWTSAGQAGEEKAFAWRSSRFDPFPSAEATICLDQRLIFRTNSKNQFSLSNIFWSVTLHCITLRMTWHEITERYMMGYDIGK